MNAATSTTSEHAAAERRAAARALLNTPILGAAHHAEDLALVRRHKVALRQTFQTLLGYPLVVEPSFARLVKAVPPADAPARGARRANGAEFTPRGYTYLALVCAGLMAPGSGEQILLSVLVEQLRADAATAGIAVDDTLGERRALVAAIDQLIEWGVLVETDGSVAAWGNAARRRCSPSRSHCYPTWSPDHWPGWRAPRTCGRLTRTPASSRGLRSAAAWRNTR